MMIESEVSSRGTPSLLVVLLILMFAVICVAGFPGVLDTYLYPKLLLFSIIGGAFCLFLIWNGSKLQPLTFTWPTLLWIAFLASSIPAAVISKVPGHALLALSRDVQIGVFAIAISAVANNRSDLIQKLALASLIVLICWGGLELVLALEGFELTHQATYTIKASLGHRNLFGQFLPLLSALSLPLLWSGKRIATLAILTILTGSMLCFALLSRSAWVMVAVLFIAIMIGAKLIPTKPDFAFRKHWKWMIAGAVFLLVAFMFLVLDQLYTIGHHFETAVNLEEGTSRDRWLLIERSWRLFLQHPLFGAGIGMWPLGIMSFEQNGMLSESARVFYQRPHNDYVWVFSERGTLAGLFFFGTHIVGLVLAAIHFYSERTPIALAQATTWLLFILVSFTNFPMERMEYAVVMVFLLASGKEKIRLEKRRFFGVLVLAFMVAAVYVYSARLVSESHYMSALDARSEEDWSGYVHQIQEAEGTFFRLDEVSRPPQWHAGFGWSKLNELGKAEEAFEQAAALNPYHPEIQNSLGICDANRKNFPAALRHFQNAVINTPTYEEGWLNTATIQRAMGDWRSAFESLLHADPSGYNPGYAKLGAKLAADSLTQMISNYPERKLMLTVTAIRNTPEWSLSVFRNAALNELPFERQALIEACFYMLNHCEGQEDCEEIERIKTKYIPDEELDLKSK